jgi:hypothetical protein
MAVENRPASAPLHETNAFQDDVKRILIFSEAGGPDAAIMRIWAL